MLNSVCSQTQHALAALGPSTEGWMLSLKGPSCPCQAEKLIRFFLLGPEFQLLHKEILTFYSALELLAHFCEGVQDGTSGRCCP